MKTLQILNNVVNSLVNESSFYVVSIKEDNFENSGDPNFHKSETFRTLPEAFNYFQDEVSKIKTFQTESQYKEIELILNDDNDIFEVLETESYNAKYSKEDYGKYILHYLPKNNGISVSKIEIIDKNTPFYVNEDKRFSVKSELFDNKEETIKTIYNYSLYISEEEAKELFELFLN